MHPSGIQWPEEAFNGEVPSGPRSREIEDRTAGDLIHWPRSEENGVINVNLFGSTFSGHRRHNWGSIMKLFGLVSGHLARFFKA